MSLISKKDVHILLDAGFSEEDLGLVDGGVQGVEVYETPEDYFAKELIENACEQGMCNLMDDIIPIDRSFKELYDTSHKSLYQDQEYAGNDDPFEDVPVNLREQAEWLKTIKLGKLTIWQRRSDKGDFEWQVKNLKVVIPEDDIDRYNRMPKEDQRELWRSYAKDEWVKLWQECAFSLKYIPIEETVEFITRKGIKLNILILLADNIREMGYKNLPPEARWITIIYWEKDNNS